MVLVVLDTEGAGGADGDQAVGCRFCSLCLWH